MQKIKLLRSGKIIELTNNEAHSMIDAGLAELHKPEGKEYESPSNKMFEPQKGKLKKGYKTK